MESKMSSINECFQEFLSLLVNESFAADLMQRIRPRIYERQTIMYPILFDFWMYQISYSRHFHNQYPKIYNVLVSDESLLNSEYVFRSGKLEMRFGIIHISK